MAKSSPTKPSKNKSSGTTPPDKEADKTPTNTTSKSSSKSKTSNVTPPPSSPSPSSGINPCVVAFVLLFGIITTVIVGLNLIASSEDELNVMPPQVQEWLEKGIFAPFTYNNGQEIPLFSVSGGSKKSSETILLVSDIYTSSQQFQTVLPLLAKGGHRVVAFDFPGFGLSGKTFTANSTASLAQTASFIRSVLKLLHLRPVHVVAQGWAAHAAAHCIRASPHMFRSLTVFGIDPNTNRAQIPTSSLFRSVIPSNFQGSLLQSLFVLPGASSLAHFWLKSSSGLIRHDTFSTEDSDNLLFNVLRQGGGHRFIQALNEKAALANPTHFPGLASGFPENIPVQTLFWNPSSSSVEAVKTAVDNKDEVKHKLAHLEQQQFFFLPQAEPVSFTSAVLKFIDGQEKTPLPKPEEIPEHIKRQLEQGGGHAHAHGGHGHSHGHDHGGGHGFGHNFGL
eukprot:m.166014 g.166014  ORF g.166014 m.166014 type:complete len:450 (+) comp24997_c1_seq3:1-1350(+)